MTEFPKPLVVASRCLGFAHCRYNGQTIPSHFVEELKPYVEFQTPCPEVEIGLGVPRDPIRLVSMDGELRLVQPSTGRDVTEEMRAYAEGFLSSLGEVDGFILKSRSPSCGPRDVKVYPGTGKVASTAKSAGFFGAAVLARFPDLAVEDEGRLSNWTIREHFLTRLFASARFRQVKRSGRMRDLVQFHAENKLLLMAYHQAELRILGRIVANPEKKPVAEVLQAYEQHLRQALAKAPRRNSSINVLMHTLGYFSSRLSSAEKAFFLDSLQKYREQRIPLGVPIGILRSWIVRFEEGYLQQQTFFAPYPEELIEVTDSGKGREL